MKKLTMLLSVVLLAISSHAQLDVKFSEAWADADVSTLAQQIETTPFPREKLELVKKAMRSELGFTAAQTVTILKSFKTSTTMANAVQLMDDHILGMSAADVTEILNVLTFSSHKLTVLEVLRFCITDEDNKYNVLDAFNTQRDKDAATKILKAVPQPRSFIYGTVKGDRVIFVIDISASMEATFTTNTGQTLNRLDFVKMELEKVLKGMGQHVKFNIIIFGSDVNYWRRSMVLANQNNKKDALDYVARLTTSGATNIYGAMQTCFNDPEVSTLYFLTDGTPTEGAKTDEDAILDDVELWNKNRNVTVHTTAFLMGDSQWDDKSASKKFMRRMARRNNGVFRALDKQD